uniref:Copine 5 n=1 Tax=Paramormyrops kingsleyae TaxID=1676925 RepID=A0A3B3S3P4_9TELE
MDKSEDMASVCEFDPGTGNIPATKVEITVSCSLSFPDMLLTCSNLSLLSPVCVLYTQEAETKQWKEFGRTEVIDNTLNPDFVQKYILDYFFEEKQNLLSPKYCSLCFCAPTQLGIPGKKCGTIILTAEELDNCRDCATMQFCANKLDKKDFFGKSDPFMVFYRSNEDGTFTICHKTEVVKTTLNPVWQPFSIPVRALCNGDYERYCYNFSVCSFHFVTLLSFSVESEYTFLDYIKGGTQIHFTVAIDFTASNGNPSQSTSLHYMNPYQMNAYAMALKAVGEIIQDYDSDKMFPALGFGAKLPPDGRVSHEFPLNGNAENPYCSGMEGILEAYHQSLKTVQLYGPTNFAPVVNHVARYASAVHDGSQYFVLLIITDGVISDMAQTKEAIVNAAKLPMSIIIVGVGQAEFDAMVELDGDDIRISSRGKLAERDIVQFVPFRDYMDRTGNHVLSMARLAKDVLAEIPEQFISYMKSRAIKPNTNVPRHTPSGHTLHTQI